jgi:polyphosphate kinase 2 (PPK2 family)
MGYCTKQQRDNFLRTCPMFQSDMVEKGLDLVKYWLEVSPQEQKKRFEDRVNDPAKNWKLSPMDLESRRRWYECSLSRDAILDATDPNDASWTIPTSARGD